MVKLKRGDRRWAVRFLQRALNKRSKARGFPFITVDGILGDETLLAVQRVGRALGALESTLAIARRDQTVSIGLQRMIRFPALRNPKQLQRARDRKAAEENRDRGPLAALAEAKRCLGRTEWTNRSWVMSIIRACGGWTFRVPWCGCFVHHCLKAAGVSGITSRLASVNLTLLDGLAGRNGMRSCVYRRSTEHGSVSRGQPGDVIGLFGESTHMALIVKRVPGGYRTREGNTSNASAANGGTVAEKTRPDSAVAYIVRPRY